MGKLVKKRLVVLDREEAGVQVRRSKIRRMRQARRIRWRRFDGDGDGVLTAEEVTQLCEALVARPDEVLVTSQDESEPKTHPRYRDRILLLHQAYPGRLQSYQVQERNGTSVLAKL